MKKIPQPDESNKPSGNEPAEEPAPVLPGTEQARSLGDMMREAETAEAASRAASTAQTPLPAATADKPKRVKKVSRSQARRHARERALQALYQWDVSTGQATDVLNQFLDEQDMSRVDIEYFTKLFKGVSHNPDAVDEAMSDSLDRPNANLDPIERAVLRIATYELTQCLDIPARVVINEGIEITKRFGADKGHRYVNGVLDKLAAAVRPSEMRKR